MGYFLIILTCIIAALQIDNLTAKPFILKAWITLGLLIIATIITFIVEGNKSNQEIFAKKIAKKESDKRDHARDSIADLRITKSNQLILNGIGDAIGKYSLGYDSAKKEIAKLSKLIKDSANRKSTYVQGDNPTMAFCDDIGINFNYIRNDTIYYSINICSYSAASILNSATFYIMYSNNKSFEIFKNLEFSNKVTPFAKNTRIVKDAGIQREIYITKANKIKSIIMLLQGNYSDSYGKNPQKIDQVGILDLATKKFGIVAPPYDNNVRDFLKNKGFL